MGYYRAGDFYRGGAGYYRGYYAAGGFGSFLKKVGHVAGGLLQSPVGSLVTKLVPFGGTAVALGQALGGHQVKAMQASGVQAGPMSAVAKSVAAGGGSLPPSAASAPGHSAQALTSGGMMVSHQPISSGTPGANAAAGGLVAMGGKRQRARRRTRRTSRRAYAPRRSRRSSRRSRRSSRRGDYYDDGQAGDIRRAKSGRFMSGHRFPRRKRRGGGGRVSFTTKDGRRVSFNAR